MLKVCALCKKGLVAGRNIVRKGLAKKKGGTGKKTTRVNKRIFFANLQRMRILVNGHPKRVYICTKCIKRGRIQRA